MEIDYNLVAKYLSGETSPGEHSELVLPDNTHIWLNTASAVAYPSDFSAQKRYVRLLEGGAVSKSAEHRFTVRSADLDIEVYGTTFEVRAYGQEPQMEVALQEGKVKVLDHGGIIGQFAENDGTLEKCIAWNAKVSSSSNSAAAAPVIGNSHQNATLTDNYRKADMEVSTTWTNWTAFNHANASSSTPLTDSNGNALTAEGPYFGKVDNGKTIFEIANTLGWDATIWNLSSGSHPTLISNP